ncbi:MAG TPA: L-glutamate gamma-semialdehyde dehydrogenase, partial [Tianweitania sediminis]|nr:L-glutamate gamma-semialdehyde dehydrogenase [Tianweitania sediminis]
DARPITPASGETTERLIRNPARPDDLVGTVHEASAELVDGAVAIARAAQPAWATRPASERAAILQRAADLYEEHEVEFFALATREAGKTLADGLAEVREAVDFLRYYAVEAAADGAGTQARGVIACISPWNFPLAIFTGQIAAALVTGNAVIAKPAEQTPLIAARAVALLHEAGVPAEVLHLLPGDGASVGGPLTAHPDIAGVCFTGSTEVARLIERQLAETAAPDAMLIAETGGLNAMIVDSTALPEQAVRDILASAFQSAGQRCSALRILYVQKDVETKVMEMLTGAMQCLSVGDPWQLATDVGPLIDHEAQEGIRDYVTDMERKGKLVAKLEAPANGTFVGPHILKVQSIGSLEREVFGPVLHVATFGAEQLERVIGDINARGFGLTFGLHTRIDARVQAIVDQVHAGNIYVNRNQIGAVVGSQPFGGEGLSGTGPKAGGPHYLRRFRKAAESTAQAETVFTTLPLRLRAGQFPDAAEKGWSTSVDRIATLRKLLRGKGRTAIAAAAATEYGPIDLPGPTGEGNTLTLYPRGRVLCLGQEPEVLLAQVIQALAAGNSVLAAAPSASATLSALAGKDLPLVVLDGMVEPGSLAATDADLLACRGSAEWMQSVRRALAKRVGAIIPIVSETLYPTAYTHERAVCVDTTAAGGNASLLAGSSEGGTGFSGASAGL